MCASVSALHPLSSEIRPWQLRPTEGEAGKAAQLHKGPRLSRWGITPPEWRTPSQALEAALCVGRDPSSSARGGSGELESWRKPWDPGAPAVPAHSLLLGGAPADPRPGLSSPFSSFVFGRRSLMPFSPGQVSFISIRLCTVTVAFPVPLLGRQAAVLETGWRETGRGKRL